MGALFSKPKMPQEDVAAKEAQQKAQRRQDQSINKQSAEEAVELGARRRMAAARAGGRNSLFSTSGAAGVTAPASQETLG